MTAEIGAMQKTLTELKHQSSTEKFHPTQLLYNMASFIDPCQT